MFSLITVFDRTVAPETTEAATKIQAGFRGHKARKEVVQKKQEIKESHEAATKIQAGFKGHKARKEVNAKKKQLNEENEAATKIQAGFRGHKARKDMKVGVESDEKEEIEETVQKEETTELHVDTTTNSEADTEQVEAKED